MGSITSACGLFRAGFNGLRRISLVGVIAARKESRTEVKFHSCDRLASEFQHSHRVAPVSLSRGRYSLMLEPGQRGGRPRLSREMVAKSR